MTRSTTTYLVGKGQRTTVFSVRLNVWMSLFFPFQPPRPSSRALFWFPPFRVWVGGLEMAERCKLTVEVGKETVGQDRKKKNLGSPRRGRLIHNSYTMLCELYFLDLRFWR
jgi:hypothetical protein